MSNVLGTTLTIHPSLQLQWAYDQRIAVIRSNTAVEITEAAVDAWAEWLQNTIIGWREDQPLLILHDFRNAYPTPYGQSRALQLLRQAPQSISGRYAALIGITAAGQLVQSWVRVARRYSNCDLTMRSFVNESAALRWLAAGVAI